MKRISFSKISLFSDKRFYKFEPVNNRLINFYLNGFKRREKNKEKLLIVLINYITVFSYILCIVKYLAGFKKLSYSNQAHSVWCVIIVGWHWTVQQNLINIGSDLWSGSSHLRFAGLRVETHKEWTQVFELTRSRAPHRFIKQMSRIDNLINLVKAMKVIYKIWNALSIISSKIMTIDSFVCSIPTMVSG